jgi:starch synthase (maltosyl-transferring)
VTRRLEVDLDATPTRTGSQPMASSLPSAGRPPARVLIAGVEPEVDGGRYAVKRVVGEAVEVRATVVVDGHEELAVRLLVRRGDGVRHETAMAAAGNDRWVATFVPDAVGPWEYTVEAWIDRFASWRWGFARKHEAGHDVRSELGEGAALVGAAAARADGPDRAWLAEQASRLAGADAVEARAALALDPELAARMARHPDRDGAAILGRAVRVVVERERAAFGAWYECFPRSTTPEPGRHGTLRDLVARLPYVAGMGFDVLYLPPIHPIGRTHRKGRDNALEAGPDDPGSPWAIGAAEGGHTAIHPALGSLDDFAALVTAAGGHGLEVALDLAFQCSPDHPWVTAHPEWFRHRPDGTVQYAENPPKRYQDIVPFDFECAAWRALWDALRDVVLFWIARGVTIFRADNPHTKPLAFWEWLIADVRARHPETIFLAEAFTRPAVMHELAKLGFSQSYTYFTWRNTKTELVAYATELAQACDSLRPNFFANTPDILPEYLQTGGRAAFQARLVLAATLGGSYGIYGPPFEQCVGAAVPGGEEYLHSEKYELRRWDVEAPGGLRDLVARVNRIRRDNPAFRHPRRLRFLPVANDALLAYARSTPDRSNVVIVVVNLDPHHAQAGEVELPLRDLGLDGAGSSFQVDDLLGGARYLWHGSRGYVALDPAALPAHVFRVRRRVHTERDFDYYL